MSIVGFKYIQASLFITFNFYISLSFCLSTCSCSTTSTLLHFLKTYSLLEFFQGLNKSHATIWSQILLINPLPPFNKAYILLYKRNNNALFRTLAILFLVLLPRRRFVLMTLALFCLRVLPNSHYILFIVEGMDI